jgi:hypothetical protein
LDEIYKFFFFSNKSCRFRVSAPVGRTLAFAPLTPIITGELSMKELKKNLVFGFLLVAFVIASEIIMARLALPAWPAFMVMIFFFIAHEDLKTAPGILVGGLAGIACVMLVKEFIHALGPVMGDEAAKLLFIGIFVYSIVLLKDAAPYVFNSYAFMFFLVAANVAREPGSGPWVWMVVEVVAGAIFIAGILGIAKITAFLIRE